MPPAARAGAATASVLAGGCTRGVVGALPSGLHRLVRLVVEGCRRHLGRDGGQPREGDLQGLLVLRTLVSRLQLLALDVQLVTQLQRPRARRGLGLLMRADRDLGGDGLPVDSWLAPDLHTF